MRDSIAIAMLASGFLYGCHSGDDGVVDPVLSSKYVSVEDDRINLTDNYLEIDRKALVGVDKKAANQALSGNGKVARAIGSEFAAVNRVDEARFWFQVAAENGDGVAMRNLSLALEDFSCTRSIYWLKKSLDTNHIGKMARASMEKELVINTKKCDALISKAQ